LLSGLFTGCGRQFDEADFTFLNGNDPETVDPALITGQLEFRIVDNLFEGLLRYDETGSPVPGVAERWETNDDATQYTFYLRDDALWSNGDPVTARDFARSWERALNPATAASYAYQLFYIKNAEAYSSREITDFSEVGVKALDDRTLRVDLANPTPFFLHLAAFPTLRPVHMPTIEMYGDDWVKPENIVTNGPFNMTAWKLYDRIRFERNPLYWDVENVAFQTVDALAVDDPNTIFNYYHSGLADLMLDKSSVPVNLIGELQDYPDFHAAPFLGNYFLRFNVTNPPFDDPRVRKAFSLAVDRRRIVEKVTRSGEEPADSLVPPGTAGYQPPEGLTYNPERARELMAEAGYPGGKAFPSVTYLYNAKEMDKTVAVELQDMFQEVLGVNMTLNQQEWKVYLNSMNELNYDISRSSWVGDYNDPNTFLDMFVTGGGNNRTGWGNEEYDRLIAQAATVTEQEARYALFREAEELLVSEAAVIVPIHYYVGVQLYDDDKLGGIQPNLLDIHPIQDMYWKE
jgi:oligopeptide transport system substrate-binding protein